MVDLVPAPSSLGLASPALGPWFNLEGAPPTSLPTLAAPAANLSVAVSLAPDMEWRAPANAILSYFVATEPRPAGIAQLRQENGAAAFAAGDLVVLLTLLPEVELRLQALSNAIPSPDGNAVPANVPSRPRLRWLALALPSASFAGIATVGNLRENDLPATLVGDADKAAHLGLALDGGVLGNAGAPSTELRRPARDSAIVVKNRTGATLGAALWVFDHRGRALDPGAVAVWWSHLASPGIFDNLWAHDDATMQRTAEVAPGNSVQLCSANEGPLDAALLARLTRTGLTQTTGSTALFSVGNPASLALGAAPDPDDAPLARIALLPHGGYAAPATSGAALFAGWNGTAWPATLPRDFARVAMLDIEGHLVGLTRADSVQAAARTRVAALRNTAAGPFRSASDGSHQRLVDTLNAGAAARVVSPVIDAHWGALAVGSLGSGALPDTLDFSVRALAGEGTSAGDTAADQRVVVEFPPGALPAGGWVRLWPHGLDTETGLRFRQDGGGGLADAGGRAFVVMAIPDGTAAPSAPEAPPLRLSFDALVVTDDAARYYVEQRYDRPAVAEGSRIALAAPPDVPPATTLWLCERGAAMARGAGGYGAGETLLGVPDDSASGSFALVDLATLDDSDVSAGTLRRAAGSGDTLIVTEPAFATTAEGDVTTSPGPGGAAVVRHERDGLSDLDAFGRPLPLMERREVAAVDTAATTGFVGATPGRAGDHENPPAQRAHPGLPAAAEIHGGGVDLAGPAIGPLSALLTERAATTLDDFVTEAQRPVAAIPDPGGTTSFAAVLETLSFGVAGDAALRAFVAATPAFLPGQSWLDVKNAIESATGRDLDPLIDTATFDDEALAGALDRVILKTRDGAFQAATALQAAIARAEDFVYVETPAIDPLAAGAGDAIDLVGAIVGRWAERPALKVLLCVPERYLPGQPAKLDAIRRAGVAAAHKALRDANAANVELFTPIAGTGRRLHMASTTVIVDDVWLMSGSTHLWRRGLSFDASLAVALFDENVAGGRPSAVRAARRQLFVERLGLAAGLAPDDPADMLEAVRRLNAAGGLQRVAPEAYPAAEDTTSAADRDVWNPDGRPGGVSDWFLFLAGLGADALDEVNDAIR